MSAENVAVVRRIYEAFGRGDVPAVLGAMDPGIVWYEAENFPYADNNPYLGPEAVAGGVFMRCATEWDGFAVHMTDFIDGGDRVVAMGRYAGIHRVGGGTMNPQAVHVWTLTDGKAVAFQQHIDTLDVAKAMGKA